MVLSIISFGKKYLQLINAGEVKSTLLSENEDEVNKKEIVEYLGITCPWQPWESSFFGWAGSDSIQVPQLRQAKISP